MIEFEALKRGEASVGVVGLGYVGLPLALALAKHFKVVGFDASSPRVAELSGGQDRTREASPADLRATSAVFTADPSALKDCAVVIVAVPTPIDGHRNPDLGAVRAASRTVGQNLRRGAVVVYESTVYPGVTEDVCAPILEEASGLRCGADFTLGYSPERINPGDKVHTLETIIKVVAGVDGPTLDLLAALYGAVVAAGVHRASTIKVAEAAKVIENTQRDLNIALMNELSLIFERLGIDTLEVLQAAGTKWNFLPFRPGLVGGHCIGVDPYYLTFKAEELGLHPQVILAGRRINDSMGKHVAESAVKRLIQLGVSVNHCRIGLLGLTFKENVPDLRNTRVVDIIHELASYSCEVLVHDPCADPDEARHEYGLALSPMDALRDLDCVILAVAHAEFASLTPERLRGLFRNPDRALVMDVKGALPKEEIVAAGMAYWRL